MKIVCFIIVILMFSCNGIKETSSAEEYLSYFVDVENGLLKKTNFNNSDFTVLYETPEYIAIKETRGEIPTKEAIDSRVKELSGLQYFTLRINISQYSDEQKQNLREYFFEKAQTDFKLKTSAQEFTPVMYHFEQDFGVLPYCTIFLGFQVEKLSTAELLFNSSEIGNDNVTVTFNEKELNSIPKFKLPNS